MESFHLGVGRAARTIRKPDPAMHVFRRVRLDRGREVVRHSASCQRYQAGTYRYDRNEDIERRGTSICTSRLLRIL